MLLSCVKMRPRYFYEAVMAMLREKSEGGCVSAGRARLVVEREKRGCVGAGRARLAASSAQQQQKKKWSH